MIRSSHSSTNEDPTEKVHVSFHHNRPNHTLPACHLSRAPDQSATTQSMNIIINPQIVRIGSLSTRHHLDSIERIVIPPHVFAPGDERSFENVSP